MTVNGARVLRQNIGASNGMIHVVNSVLAPPAVSAMELLDSNKEISLFRKALKMSGINISDGDTIFAPTNQAFNDLDTATFERLLNSPTCLKVGLLCFQS